MGLIERLAKLKESLADDGSREMADSWMKIAHESQEMSALLTNSAFAGLLGKMKADFMARVDTLVKKDPELAAMKRMFVRTIGLKGAEKKIAESIDAYIDSVQE